VWGLDGAAVVVHVYVVGEGVACGRTWLSSRPLLDSRTSHRRRALPAMHAEANCHSHVNIHQSLGSGSYYIWQALQIVRPSSSFRHRDVLSRHNVSRIHKSIHPRVPVSQLMHRSFPIQIPRSALRTVLHQLNLPV
jgi:hypothetical protein